MAIVSIMFELFCLFVYVSFFFSCISYRLGERGGGGGGDSHEHHDHGANVRCTHKFLSRLTAPLANEEEGGEEEEEGEGEEDAVGEGKLYVDFCKGAVADLAVAVALAASSGCHCECPLAISFFFFNNNNNDDDKPSSVSNLLWITRKGCSRDLTETMQEEKTTTTQTAYEKEQRQTTALYTIPSIMRALQDPHDLFSKLVPILTVIAEEGPLPRRPAGLLRSVALCKCRTPYIREDTRRTRQHS